MSSDRTPAEVIARHRHERNCRIYGLTFDRLAPQHQAECIAIAQSDVDALAAAGFRVTPEPDDTTRDEVEPFYAIRRADGELLYGEFGWLGVDGFGDWSCVEDDDPDPPTAYELVRMRGEVVARRIFGTLMCDCPDADCGRCDDGVIDLGKLPHETAAAALLDGHVGGSGDTR